jgi:hypothetical protein
MSSPRSSELAETGERWYAEHYAHLGTTIDSILSHKGDEKISKLESAIYRRILIKRDCKSSCSWTDEERKFVAVVLLREEVRNGGFEQYFVNSHSNDYPDALAGLRDIGAHDALSITERAFSVFPDGLPATDSDTKTDRRLAFPATAARIWSECSRDFWKLTDSIRERLVAYAERNKSGFKFT